MFNKDYKLLSTSIQRKQRYSIAAERVEKVSEEMLAEIQRLRQEGAAATQLMKNATYYSLETTRLELKREELLQHLAVLRSPDSLYCIAPLHPVRVQLRVIVGSSLFGRFINFAIAGSALSLAMERPGIQPKERTFLDLINTALNVVFLIEVLMKIVMLSFKSYWADSWNRLDLVIVGIAYFDEIVTRSGLAIGTGALKVLRILRLLRPLRALRSLRALTVLSAALLKAAYPLVVTTCIILMIVSCVSAITMQLLMGDVNLCTDPHVEQRESCTGVREDGIARHWQPNTFSYDWIGAGVLSTLIFALNEAGWIDVAFALADSTGKHTGPYEWARSGMAALGLATLVVVGFVFIKIYTAIFVQVYTEEMRRNENEMAAENQLSHHATNTKIKRKQLPLLLESKQQKLKVQLRDLLEHPRTEGLIVFCVLISLSIMGVESYKMSASSQQTSIQAEFFFTFTFAIELSLKIWCYKISRLRNDIFSMIDWLIVILSFMTVPLLLMLKVQLPIDPKNLRFIRLVRILRILRLLRAIKVFAFVGRVESLADAIFRATPSLFRMVVLLGVLYFCFGVLGISFFGYMCGQGDETRMMRCLIMSPDTRLPYSQSFQHMGTAFLTLFRLSSGDAWSGLVDKLGMSVAAFPRAENHLDTARDALSAFTKAKSDVELELALRTLQRALPGCVTSKELRALEDGVALDCGLPNHCDSTCGSMLAYIYVPFFVVLTNFVIFQLVVPPLMIEIGRQLQVTTAMRGCNKLPLERFVFIWTRWRRQGYVKKLVTWVDEERRRNPWRMNKAKRGSSMRELNGSSMRDLNAGSGMRGSDPKDGKEAMEGGEREREGEREASTANENSVAEVEGGGEGGRGMGPSSTVTIGVRYQGEVSKRGQLNPAFKRRYFVLPGDGTLKYYHSKKAWEENPLAYAGSIACKGLVCHEPRRSSMVLNSNNFPFTLTDAMGKQIECACDSLQERAAWRNAILKAYILTSYLCRKSLYRVLYSGLV